MNNQQKLNWNDFTKEEKLATQNAILLVGLLYKMCQVKLVEQSKNQDELNKINKDLVTESINMYWRILLKKNNFQRLVIIKAFSIGDVGYSVSHTSKRMDI